MPPPSLDSVPERIAERFDVSRESLARLKVYVALLLKWQGRINLIGPAEAETIWTRHVADSLQLMPLIGPRPGRIVDLGSGAGFPGLVLAIMLGGQAGDDVHLIESNGKKVVFLRQAARITDSSVRISPWPNRADGACGAGRGSRHHHRRAVAGSSQLVDWRRHWRIGHTRALIFTRAKMWTGNRPKPQNLGEFGGEAPGPHRSERVHRGNQGVRGCKAQLTATAHGHGCSPLPIRRVVSGRPPRRSISARRWRRSARRC